jgi:hypothetical protein
MPDVMTCVICGFSDMMRVVTRGAVMGSCRRRRDQRKDGQAQRQSRDAKCRTTRNKLYHTKFTFIDTPMPAAEHDPRFKVLETNCV